MEQIENHESEIVIANTNANGPEFRPGQTATELKNVTSSELNKLLNSPRVDPGVYEGSRNEYG